MSLTQLPTELLSEIAVQLSLTQLLNLRAVNKHVRRILGVDHDPWAHLHISIPAGEDMDVMRSYLGNEDLCPYEATTNEHRCERGYIKVGQNEVFAFCKALRDGDLNSFIPRVRTISIAGCYFLPKGMIDYSMTDDNLSTETTSLYSWLLKKIPATFSNLTNVEVACQLETYMAEVENEHRGNDGIEKAALVAGFLTSVGCAKKIYVDTEERMQTFETFKRAMKNITNIQVLQVDGFAATRYMHVLSEQNMLCESLKRLELYNGHKSFPVHAFRLFLSRCCNLKVFKVQAVEIHNTAAASVDWVPPHCQELELAEFNEFSNHNIFSNVHQTELTTMKSPNVLKRLKIEHFMGRILTNLALSQLELLRIDWALLPETYRPLRTEHFNHALHTNLSGLKQLHCWGVPVSSLLQAVGDDQPVQTVESLVLAGSEPLTAGYSKLGAAFPSLRYLYISLNKDALDWALKELRQLHTVQDVVVETDRSYVDFLIPLADVKDTYGEPLEVFPGSFAYKVNFEKLEEYIAHKEREHVADEAQPMC